jgi:hypothetical protein
MSTKLLLLQSNKISHPCSSPGTITSPGEAFTPTEQLTSDMQDSIFDSPPDDMYTGNGTNAFYSFLNVRIINIFSNPTIWGMPPSLTDADIPMAENPT